MQCLRTRNQTKESNLGEMPENPKQNKRIKSGRDIGEPRKKGRDRIWARCQRTRIKTKGTNLAVIPENMKQREGIEFGRDVGESEKKWKGSNLGAIL